MNLSEVTVTPKYQYESIVKILVEQYAFDMPAFGTLDAEKLQRISAKCQTIKSKILSECSFNSYHKNPQYNKACLIEEAVKILLKEIAPKRTKRKKTNEAADLSDGCHVRVEIGAGLGLDADRLFQIRDKLKQFMYPAKLADSKKTLNKIQYDFRFRAPEIAQDKVDKFLAFSEKTKEMQDLDVQAMVLNDADLNENKNDLYDGCHVLVDLNFGNKIVGLNEIKSLVDMFMSQRRGRLVDKQTHESKVVVLTYAFESDADAKLMADRFFEFATDHSEFANIDVQAIVAGDEYAIDETAPPSKKSENWIKSNKAAFKKEYGNQKGEEILYKTAWKNYEKDKQKN